MSLMRSSLQLRSLRRFLLSCFCTAPSSACSSAMSSIAVGLCSVTATFPFLYCILHVDKLEVATGQCRMQRWGMRRAPLRHMVPCCTPAREIPGCAPCQQGDSSECFATSPTKRALCCLLMMRPAPTKSGKIVAFSGPNGARARECGSSQQATCSRCRRDFIEPLSWATWPSCTSRCLPQPSKATRAQTCWESIPMRQERRIAGQAIRQ